MPINLRPRAAGWLLRDHYKNVMEQARQKVREQQGNPKFNPHRNTNYNFKRVLYRSNDLPKIAKLLETEIADGRISREFANELISGLLKVRSVGIQSIHGAEAVKKAAQNPRKSIEESIGISGKIGSLPMIDEATGNTVSLERKPNGDITLSVSQPKK